MKALASWAGWAVVAIVGAISFGILALDRGETISAVWLVTAGLCVYLIAYRFYSRYIADRALRLDDTRPTPAMRHNDGMDYVPTNKWVLYGHHFAAIAGAGPLVGPVLAAQMGFLPGTLWILTGVVVAGAVQDFIVLFVSVRRDGKSLGEMIKMELGPIAGAFALVGVLAIMIIILAVLALVVVKAPRAARQRLDDDEREHRQDDDHDREHADEREGAGDGAELHLDHLAERLAVAPHRDEEDHEVLDRAGDDHAREDPERAGQVAHLRGEHGPDQWARAGDGSEVVAVQHVLVRGHVVEPVVVPHRGRGPARVDAEGLLGDELAVEAVGDEVDAERRRHEPHRVDALATAEGQRAERDGAQHRDHGPQEKRRKLAHRFLLAQAVAERRNLRRGRADRKRAPVP